MLTTVLPEFFGITSITTTGFAIETTTALVASTAYQWSYAIIG